MFHAKSISTALLCLGAFLLLSFACYKACTMSMTHDESGSYLFYLDTPLFESLFNKNSWTSANNHLLNTFLFQKTTSILGPTEFSMRLPNLISFFFYLITSILLSRGLSKNLSAVLLCFVLLNLNPYFLDFFYLARGYGLGNMFLLVSLYFTYKYFHDYKNKWHQLAIISLCLGSLSIFTVLIYIPTYYISLVLIRYFLLKHTPSNIFKSSILPIFILVIFGAMIYIPIAALLNINEFKYGATSIFEMFEQLAIDSLDAHNYLGSHTTYILMTLISVSTFFSLYLAMNNYRKGNKDQKSIFHIFLALSWIIICGGMIFQHYLLGSNYFISRKTTILLPHLSLILYFSFTNVSLLNKHIAPILVSFLFIVHFMNKANLTHTREWWYENNTKDMILDVNEQAQNKRVTLATNWLFHPSTTFYIETMELDSINLYSYNKNLTSDRMFDYYYIMCNQTQELSSKYNLYKKYDHDYCLLNTN